MTSPLSKYLGRPSLSVAFALAVVTFIGVVQYKDTALTAMTTSMPSPAVATTAPSPAAAGEGVNPRVAAKLARLKRQAVRRATTALVLHPRLSPRMLRTSTASNVLHGSDVSTYSSIQYEKAKCGDGLVIAPETCDDGRTSGGDGCSNTCKIEAGYQCTTGQPSYCWDQCGDGAVSAREKCDDGNDVIDDGCNTDCQIEPGYTCTGTKSVCTHAW